jgi:mycothiol system anti-sigma-R factor
MESAGPDDINCADALQKVFLLLDGEIDSTDVAEAKHHIAECAPCLREYGLEEEVKRLVYRSCRNEQVPADLRAKVLIRIEQISIELRP